MKSWKDRTREVMLTKGLTQRVVAAHMSRSQSTLACWLNGRNTPNINDMNSLADALGVDPAWLTYGIEARENPVICRVLEALNGMRTADLEKIADILEALKATSRSIEIDNMGK